MGTHITRRYFIQGLGLMSASAALAACAQQQQATGSQQAGSQQAAGPLLAIIHTNDTHGHDVEVQSTENVSGNFSLAAVPKLKAEWEAKGYDVLVLDAGDATQGTPLVDQYQGQTGITFLNACSCQAMAVGNHEFDRGEEQLEKYEAEAEFPLLSANVLLKETNKPCFVANKTFELSDGTKVGVFGLTTPATMTTSKPDNTKAFTFLENKELYACAQQQVDELRKAGCGLVVCLGHLGNDEVCEPDTSKDVLKNVTGIDLFIDGHDHKLVEEEVNGSLLVETGCYLNNIGLVLIDKGAPTNASLVYGSFEGVDTAAQAVIDNINNEVQSALGVVLGHTGFFLNGKKDPGLRTQETNLGDFCCDAMKWSVEQNVGHTIDGAVYNGGALRSSIEAGDITLAIIKTVCAFSNQYVLLTLTGAQMLETLEAGYQDVGVEAIGAFPQLAGIEVRVDASVPFERGDLYPNSTYYAPAKPGARVTILSIGGKEWSADATYQIATLDFLTQGGDTYYVFKQAADAETPVTCDFDYEAFSSYLIVECDHEVPERYAEPQGRIAIVGA